MLFNKKELKRIKRKKILEALKLQFPNKNIEDEDATYISPFLYVALKDKIFPVPDYWKYKKPNKIYNKKIKLGEIVEFTNTFYYNNTKPFDYYDGTNKYFYTRIVPGKISIELFNALNQDLSIFENKTAQLIHNEESMESL